MASGAVSPIRTPLLSGGALLSDICAVAHRVAPSHTRARTCGTVAPPTAFWRLHVRSQCPTREAKGASLAPDCKPKHRHACCGGSDEEKPPGYGEETDLRGNLA